MHTRRMEERKVTTLSAPRCEIIIQLPQWHEINLVVHHIRWTRPGKSFPYIRGRLSISLWKLQCAECIAPNRRASRSLPASDWMHSRDADSVERSFLPMSEQATPLPSARAWWISTLMAFAYSRRMRHVHGAWAPLRALQFYRSPFTTVAATNLRHLRGYLSVNQSKSWNIDLFNPHSEKLLLIITFGFFLIPLVESMCICHCHFLLNSRHWQETTVAELFKKIFHHY